jgi:hypothetical protein
MDDSVHVCINSHSPAKLRRTVASLEADQGQQRSTCHLNNGQESQKILENYFTLLCRRRDF